MRPLTTTDHGPPRASASPRRVRRPDARLASRRALERTRGPAAALALALGVSGVGAAEDPSPSLRVFPPQVRLDTVRDRQSIVVQTVQPNGITRDVTAEARLELGAPVARLEGNVLLPLAEGAAELAVTHGASSVRVPVEVKRPALDPPISFRLDVMPVFMKGGCNTGSCHGAARGKDGFRLSLFGFDPAGDWHRLTRELAGRRLNLAVPTSSLLLEKATGAVPHTGGNRFGPESELYGTVRRWIEAGAPADAGEVPAIVEVEILPPESVLDGEGATQQLTVRAIYSDGSDRDVTGLAYFMTNNETVAKVGESGVVTAGQRGEAHIMARYEAKTVRTRCIVLPKGIEFAFPELPERSYVDRLVHQKLRKLRMLPSEVATDEVFLRRVTLDITGLLPTPEERERFLARAEPDKRDLLIDELLGRKEFAELWVLKFAELLQVRSSQEVSTKAMLLFYNWLKERLAGNVPMDRLVRELLASSGGTFENPATNYYQAETDTLKVAENVAQVFMGTRIQCAQCHNHPFDRWTQDEYYQFAAFFSQIGRKRGEDPRETVVFNQGSGDVRHPVTGQAMRPKFLGGPVPDVGGKDRREALASWLASPDNPFFASNLANIVWAHFFGRGIVHEVDDVRVSNPPSNQELLDELGRKLVEYRYDFRKIVRDICTSYTYQRATAPTDSNRLDDRNFARQSVRRLKAEVLLDCLSQVTGAPDKFQGLPLGARAVQIADGTVSNYFLTTFGRARRETVCSCEVVMEPNLSQALHLINGDTLTRKIEQGGLVRKRLEEGRKAEEIVEELSIRCLCRKPTEGELARVRELLASEPDARKGLEDYFWALLNSQEFLFNR